MTSLLTVCLSCLLLASCHAPQGQRTSADKQATAADTTAAAAVADTVPPLLSRAVYTAADSALVVRLLALTPKGNDVLFYARRFKGVPYVGGTLEVADPERLVVNLRELDCTTLVETTLALALTRRSGKGRFEDYLANLERLRYRDGRMNGYLSRLHYFTWWKNDNTAKGLIEEVSDSAHFTTPLYVDNHYMSAHPDRYKFLKDHPGRTDSIRAMEQRTNGEEGTYLAAPQTALGRKALACIHDGDLVAIVTRKDGIDYSHLGFAVWGKDGLLHLLNASSIHKKVVEEPKTLRQYLSEHPSSIGIRLWRLR